MASLGTALYEVKLAAGSDDGSIATVRLRYARPERDRGAAPSVREISREIAIDDLTRHFERASAHFRLDAAVAQFAEILRGSYWAKQSSFSDVLPVARSAAHRLDDQASAELVTLIEQAARLKSTSDHDDRDETH